MTLLSIDPSSLTLASLKPNSAATMAQEAAAQTQQQVAQVQLVNAQDEQQRNQAFRTQMAVAAKAPSVEAYTQLLATAPREYVEGLKASISQMDAAGKKKLADQVLEPWIAGSNGRMDLMKQKLEVQAAGFEAAGMVDKAKGVRDLIAKADSDPDGVVAKLGSTYLEAAGPERFKALGESLGWDTKRRKDKAEALKLEGEADPELILANKREKLAKAKNEEEQAKNAPQREAARARAQALEADIKATESRYKEKEILSQMQLRTSQGVEAMAKADHSKYLTDKGYATFYSDVTEAASKARKEAALATTAEADATKEAISARQEEQAARTLNFKQQAAKAEADAKALPAHVGDAVLAGSRAARESMAGAVRTRTVADGYRRLVAAGGGETGAAGKLQAWARDVAGTQNKRDRLNQLADQVLNSEIIDLAQKIRPVSDTDMKILRLGLPDSRGNPKLVVDFMDALARVQEHAATTQMDETAWQAKFRGPNNADKDTRINGINVKAGESFDGFMQRAGHVRDALSYIANPKTSPENRAKTLARLKAAGENVDGR